MMKLLSIAIPCYNSEAYMEKCIEYANEHNLIFAAVISDEI